jgi:hypothetical protein
VHLIYANKKGVHHCALSISSFLSSPDPKSFQGRSSETSKLTIKGTARGEDRTVKRKGAPIFTKISVVPMWLSNCLHHILFLEADEDQRNRQIQSQANGQGFKLCCQSMLHWHLSYKTKFSGMLLDRCFRVLSDESR